MGSLLNIVVEGVLSKAFSLASEEISLIWGVKEDLQKLAQDLKTIQDFVDDAEQKNTSKAVGNWLSRLQNVASKADNVLDEFAYETLAEKIQQRRRDKVSRFFSDSNPIVFRSRMAHKIKDITSSLEKIFHDANEIGLIRVEIAALSFGIPTSERLRTDPFVNDSEVVGRTGSAEEIVRMLTSVDGENNLSLVRIAGMPGVGKTTLAKLVYKDEKVEKHFKHKIWIHVSDNFNVERLLNEMVQSLTRTVPNLTIREAIVNELKELLRAERFLLVLDDVWNVNEELWDTMKRCLENIGASTGSRILVTTRKQSVVSTMKASFSCPLDILSDDDSWKLFDQIAFGPGGAIKSPELENIGRKIVNKCGGLPLAIKLIGRLMYTKKGEQEWSKLEESKVWNMVGDDGNEVKSAIKLSYDNLPSLSLKHCFAYCSLYGKGLVISERMIQVWMAQGLLSLSMNDQGTMEDLGWRNIDSLLQSSLLECIERDEYGNNIYCKMHDLVHDFASEVAKDRLLVGSDELLTVKNEVTKKILKQTFSEQRTLILKDHLEVALAHCEHLRILIVDDKSRQELPKSIEKLKHLRYLDIAETSITKLPNCITNLYHLQTLRLHNLQELPKDFCHLASLRHLYIQQEGTSEEKSCLLPGICVLTSLRTLPFFRVSQDGECQISELGPLNNLKGNLKIFGLENVKSLEEARKAKISTKVNLESLELYSKIEGSTRGNYSDEDVLNGLEPHSNLKGLKIENYMGKNLPQWMRVTSRPTILRNLVKVLLKKLINCEDMPPLGHLRHLKIVKCKGMRSIKSIGRDFYGLGNLGDANNPSAVAGAGACAVIFPALEELILKDMHELKKWSGVFDDGLSHPTVKILPSLVKFKVENCWKLESLPDGIWNNLSSIREVSIIECDSLSHLPEVVGQLASLEVLRIELCSNLEYIPGIHSLKCLNDLSILGCEQLRSLPNGIEACTSIEKLEIVSLPNVELGDSCQLPIIGLRELVIGGGFLDDVDYFPWPFHNIAAGDTLEDGREFQPPSTCLEFLLLFGSPKMRSLPKQIQHFSTLRHFGISDFEGIEDLPEWLGSIGSLQKLFITSCEKLLYFPSAEAMQRLINLKVLCIEDCPLLKERCKKESGPEWHKIAHIPRIEIDDLYIQDQS